MSAHVETETADDARAVARRRRTAAHSRSSAEDGRYTVALSRIVYVKRFSREGRVGFSGSELGDRPFRGTSMGMGRETMTVTHGREVRGT